MNLNSKYFDHIRVKSSSRSASGKKDRIICAHEGCDRVGRYRARKPGGGAGEYSHFCLEHIRLLHSSFASSSVSDESLSDLNFSDSGTRPTWPFGKGQGVNVDNFDGRSDHFIDPFSLYAGRLRCEEYARSRDPSSSRPYAGIAVRRALERLGLDISASSEDIRERYKFLLKRYHPDSNNGSREGEELLRSVISAYSELKSSGFV